MHARTTFAALAAAGLLALTGCTVDSSSDTTDSKPTKATTSVPKRSPAELAYLTTTRAKIPKLEDVPDKELLNLGETSCDAITAGNSPAAVAAKTEEGLKVGAENSGYIIGAAVSQLCPEHKSKL